MTTANQSPSVDVRRRAGHYEILGETYAKFEFFENGWNPYSRFLDVDKVDLILRRNVSGRHVYREVQVKYGKLYKCGIAWERELFDITSWRFFREEEFDDCLDQNDFFVAYVLAEDKGYRSDIFIFPVKNFVEIIKCGIPSKGLRKVYISHLRGDNQRWVVRRQARFSGVNEVSCLDVSHYHRNFSLLLPAQASNQALDRTHA